MEQEPYIVHLEVSKLPTGDNYQRALCIAESLIHICGLIQIWDDPKHGHRFFHVRMLPQDVPQAGVHWSIVDDLPTKPSVPWFKNSEKES